MTMAAPIHSPFGGSVSARVLRCPASVGLVAKVPAHLRKASSYAERGTALHSAMALLIDENADLESLVGKTLNNYTITRDDVENALRPAYAYVDALLAMPGAEFYLEQRVVFPTIPGAFGTVDLIVRVGARLHIVDFKFGAGVRVLALYPDGDEDIINAQLAFYAAGARHSLPEFFAGVDEIVLTILQPVSIDLDAAMVSWVAVTPAELDDFIVVYRAACEEALTPTPRLQSGAQCRFCAARPICPAHTGPLLDLAQFVVPIATLSSTDAYLQALAAGLDLVDAIKDIRTALHDQAKRALEQGDQVPGYPRPRWREVDVLDKDGKKTGERRTECSFRRAHGRAKLWRGVFCENAVQAAAADLLREAVTRIETDPALAFMPIRMTTHDEVLCEVDEARGDEAKALLRREMLTLPEWAAGLPLQSEETVSPYYTKVKRK